MANLETLSGYKARLVITIKNMNDAIECCEMFGVEPSSFLRERELALNTLERLESIGLDIKAGADPANTNPKTEY